jgi:hypothetical protein
MTRLKWSGALLVVLAGTLIATAVADSPDFPARIEVPPPTVNTVTGAMQNFSPEGITAGAGTTFYIGNTSTSVGNPNGGSIWKGDYRTGTLTNLVPGGAGRSVFGLTLDSYGRIWAAGGGTGKAWVFDATTGAELGAYTLVPTATPQLPRFINDVVATDTAVYFSNTVGSTAAGTVYNFFRIPFGPGGALPPGDPVPAPVPPVKTPAVEMKALSCGDAPGSCESAPGIFTYRGSNGIDVLPTGNLIIAATGFLWNVDPITGVAKKIVVDPNPLPPCPPQPANVCSGALMSGDGLILDGNTVYYLENRAANNATQVGDIVALELVPPDYLAAHYIKRLNSPTDPLSGPTVGDQFGHFIYAMRGNVLPASQSPIRNWITRIDKLAPTCLTGTHHGPMTIDAGEAVCLGAGATHHGPLTVKPGGWLSIQGGTHHGPVRISEAASVRICGATLTGPLSVGGSTGLVLIGGDAATDASPFYGPCAGNTITGPVTLSDNTAGVEFNHNTVTGPVRILGNTGTLPAPDTGSVHAEGNTVSGPYKVQP